MAGRGRPVVMARKSISMNTPNMRICRWPFNFFVSVTLALICSSAAYAQTAPVITGQPQDVSVNVGANVTFSVTATGTAPLSYQWFFNGAVIEGSTVSTLSLFNVTPSQTGSYSVRVSNTAGGLISNGATLTVLQTPQVTIPNTVTGYVGFIPFQYQITASNSPTSFTATGLPPGLTVNSSTGVIAGLPLNTGIFAVSVTAANSLGSGTGTLTIQIIDQPYTPAVLATNVGTPAGIAIDINASHLYFTDAGNNVVKKVTNDGTAATVILAGTGQAGSTDGPGSTARFNNPTGIGLDTVGNLFVADTNNQLIRKITPAGVVSTVAGIAGQIGSSDGVGSSASFNFPHGLAVDGAGNIFVADTINSTIRRIAPDGTVSTLAGAAGQTGSTDGTGNSARFANPFALTVDPDGNVFVLDTGNFSVRKITPSGVVTTVASQLSVFLFGSGTAAPNWIAVSGSDNLYLTVGPFAGGLTSQYAVWKITPAEVKSVPLQWSFSTSPNTPGGPPAGIAVDTAGKIYLASSGLYTLTPVSGPIISSQPQSVAVSTGQTASFNISVSGTLSPTYQWQQDGVNIPSSGNSSAATATLTLPNISTANANSSYTVVVSTQYGTVTSKAAVLTVNAPAGPAPVILSQPQSVTVNSSGTVALVVAPTDSSPLAYQWYKNGVAITGANSATLLLSNVTAANAGSYTVALARFGGTVTSAPATVTVTSGQLSRISNLSIRTNLASAQNLIVGFVTSGPKNLLIRAVGPGLGTVFGLTNFYPDPMFTVFNGSTAVDGDDDWSSGLASTFASVGAFPLTPASKDAALVRNINGADTAVVSGTGSGVMLVEVYDTESISSSTRLTNVSARNQVGTGSNILISGFVIDGTAARTVLVRGIGPALHDVFGVTGNLADPVLEIHQTVNGQDTIVASNDNWDASLTPIFDQVGAYHFSAGSKDAALLITLPPGVYTAQVSGVNSGTGDGVVEVYAVGP